MSAAAAVAPVAGRWALRLGKGLSGGVLELHVAESGYFWRWADKPAHLVQLVGVQDEYRDPAFKPYRFFDLDGAMHHLMACSGVAFRGDCGLEQVH